MKRHQVSILVLALAALVLLVVAPSVLLVIFAGLLVAALLHGGGETFARPLGLATNWGIAIVLVLLLLFLLATGGFMARALADQFSELLDQLPGALERLRDQVEQYAWAERLLQRASPAGLFSEEGRRAATSAVTSTFGAIGNLVILLFIGIYVALNPGFYRTGLRLLLAPSIRPRGEAVMDKCAATLKNWLVAQMISMTVVGTLTGIGLWLVGMPLAFILGVIAGLLAFIPNIGPILSIVPALLIAFPEGTSMVLWVVAIYVAVQALESYLITPIVQQERVNLPPAFILAMQLLLGVLFGLLGLLLAMPIAALGMTLVRELYVRDYLEREPRPIGTALRE
jgi:predicted PurR-regulated permease PerM